MFGLRRFLVTKVPSFRRTPLLSPFSNKVDGSLEFGEEVVLERDKKVKTVAILRLNRPKKLNAMSVSLGESFNEKINIIKKDKDIRSVVITGEGKAFSAGGDLEFLHQRIQTPPHHNVEDMLKFYSRFLSVTSLPVPVLAAINGSAVGAGFCLALACDLRIVAAEAKLSLNFVRLGIHPGMASTHLLPRLIGFQQATRLLMTGEVITGEEAEKIGLALKALPTQQVVEHTLEIARKISAVSPVAVQTLVHTLRSQRDHDLSNSLLKEATAQAVSYASPDLKKGLEAIKEKKEPNFD